MDFYTEWRLRGDDYEGSFGNGHTLSGSESVQGMKTASNMSESNGTTIYKGKHGHTITCIHETVKLDQNRTVITCKTIFNNTTDKPAILELLSSFAIKGIKADRIHRAASFWSAEGKLVSQDLTDLDMEPSWAHHGIRIEKFGQIGSMPVRKWFPFLVLENTAVSVNTTAPENDPPNITTDEDIQKTEVLPRFIGIQLYCASSWQIEILRKNEELYVHGGIADRDFGSWYAAIQPGKSFETPKAVIAEGGSLEEVCDLLVKAQNPRIAKADKDLPVIFNEYCTTWGNPTLENIQKIARKLEGSGVRYLVMDCGWYRPDKGEWYNAIGDWIPNRNLFPNSIKEAADAIKECGLIPGIWFELENVASASDAFRNTDHLLKRYGVPVTVGERRFWDMRDPWVTDYLDEKVIKLLKDAGFGYLKIDYNENIGAGVDNSDAGPGEGLRRTVEASLAYIKRISDHLPWLVIENCSAGGHRLEPSIMELVSQASFSDAHECACIPLIAANLHRLIRPEQSQIWAVLHAKADVHRINYLLTSAYLGRLCLSGEIFELEDEQWNLVLEGIRFYNKIKHIIKNGYTKTIRTNVKDYSKPQGYQAVLRTYDNEALLIVHTFENGANPPIADLTEGYYIADCFGSEPDADFHGISYLMTAL